MHPCMNKELIFPLTLKKHWPIAEGRVALWSICWTLDQVTGPGLSSGACFSKALETFWA